MSYMVVKNKLSRYNKMAAFAKSIELITLTSLRLLKDLHLKSTNMASIANILFHGIEFVPSSTPFLIIPYFTDKNCSGIMNNRIFSCLESISLSLSYKNIVSCVFGTGMTFQKKWLNLKKGKTGVLFKCIGNLYNLSEESFSFYKSYLLFRYIMLLDHNYFSFVFSKYLSIYFQEINYFFIMNYSVFFNLFKLYGFLKIKNRNIINVYTFSLCLLLLDITLLTSFSELGSRATSMKNTVKNARENILELTFVFNRVRQAKITNELIEILSGTL